MHIYRPIIVALPLLIAACSGNDSTGDPLPDTPPMTVADALSDMEAQGVISRAPDLDDPLEGYDIDQNGIRDDVDAWIAEKTLPPAAEEALQEYAEALSGVFTLDTTVSQDVDDFNRLAAKSMTCLVDTLGQPAYQLFDQLETLLFNTPERARTLDQLSAASSGSVISLPRGDACE